MNEQQFTYETRECCKRILNDVFPYVIKDGYIDNIHFKFHNDRITWVEYYGTKLDRFDNKAVDVIGRVMHAVCSKHNILFLKCIHHAEPA